MIINDIIKQSIKVKQDLINDEILINTIDEVTNKIINAFRNNNQLLLCGNGGSAADAQHIAAELSGRFYLDRLPLNAEALHCNSSYLTAISNDYSFNDVYSRLIKAKAKKGDILIAISTSGNSPNIINALDEANNMDLVTIGMTGRNGGLMKNKCKYLLNIPSDDTPRIQESHILIGHIICAIVESKMFS